MKEEITQKLQVYFFLWCVIYSFFILFTFFFGVGEKILVWSLGVQIMLGTLWGFWKFIKILKGKK
jgi:hypothetical protein